MNIPDIDPRMMSPEAFGQGGERTNLLTVLIDIAFGFVTGLMIFVGPKEVIEYGKQLAGELVKFADLERQIGVNGLATGIAPYLALAPILTKVAAQLASVRTKKSFIHFTVAVLVGVGIAYATQGYFVAVIS